MRHFEHFFVNELFSNCVASEITECIRLHYIDSLLILLTVLDSFRDFVGTPIHITSSYRDVQHNKLVGGSVTSQHMVGQAIDFQSPLLSNDDLIKSFISFLAKSTLKRFVGQVFFYKNFIHIGLCTPSHPKLIYYDKRTCKKSN